jgi:NADH-quinone oxidoreductase subunit M
MSGLQHKMPFIITILYLAGLCSLGLPGLSGFVSEMTVFMGSWERQGLIPRIATIAAAMSIVVTAVYILKAVTRVSMGPVSKGLDEHIGDARWNERWAAWILMAGILIIGLAPGWLNDLVRPGAEIIVNRIIGK